MVSGGLHVAVTSVLIDSAWQPGGNMLLLMAIIGKLYVAFTELLLFRLSVFYIGVHDC